MENLLNIISKKIACKLDKNNQSTETEQLQMYYGLQILLYNVTVTSLILLLSLAISTFFETLLLFAFFGTLRIIAGGYHFSSVWKCVMATTLIMLSGGKFAQLIQIPMPACLFLCLFMDIIFFKHIPRGTLKNPYSAEYSQRQQKLLRIICCFLTLTAILTDSILREIIVIAMSIVMVSLLPIYYHKFQESA